MAKIQVRRYWKRYLTKARYRYEAYYIYLPRWIAQEFLNMELSIRKVGPFIVIAPRDIDADKPSLPPIANQKDGEGLLLRTFNSAVGFDRSHRATVIIPFTAVHA